VRDHLRAFVIEDLMMKRGRAKCGRRFPSRATWWAIPCRCCRLFARYFCALPLVAWSRLLTAGEYAAALMKCAGA
jgi:hypothetical protein